MMRDLRNDLGSLCLFAATFLISMSSLGCSGDDGGGGTGSQPDTSVDAEAPDTRMADSGSQDTFDGECRTASDCDAPAEDSNKQAACTAANTCTYLCVDGYQDQNNDGTCEPTCETSDITCDVGECTIRDGSPACSCPAGLTFDEATGECQLATILEDNSFDQSDGWQVTGDASINTSDGNLVFQPGVRRDEASASQAYELGSFDEVGQLQLSMTYSLPTDCELDCRTPRIVAFAEFDGVRQAVGTFPNSGATNQTVTKCVGAAAYGGSVDFRLTTGIAPEVPAPPDAFPRIEIHEVTLTRASDGECPPRGTVRNGDFESSLDGNWSVRPDNPNTINQVVEQDGDRVMELGGTECTGAYARQQVSIPKSAETALTFSADVTGSNPLSVNANRYGGELQTEINQTSGAETQHVCIPDSDLGAVRQLEFNPSAPGGVCDNGIASSFVDDVRFTQRSECQ